MTEETKKIVIVSDGTGRTAKRLTDAVLVQYYHADALFELEGIFQRVRTQKAVDDILDDITGDYLVLFSIVSRDLARYFHEKLVERNILHLNVLKPMLDTVSKFLGVHPHYQPGLLHIIDDRYYKKVDAIGYTVEHDDGQGRHIEEADAVLLGLSRTCKTPISMYLACNFGLKVANIPVVRDHLMTANLLMRLKGIDHKKVIGLLMNPDTLVHVREERSEIMTKDISVRPELQTYIHPRHVAQECRFSRELFETQEIKTVDVTRRAIEEISDEILEKLGYAEEDFPE